MTLNTMNQCGEFELGWINNMPRGVHTFLLQLSHMFIVLSTKQWMLGSFCPIPKCLTTHLSYHRFLVNEAPCALIAKTKSNQSQGQETTLLKVLHSYLMSRYRWEGWWLRLKPSTFKPRHIICQLGSALDNVDGVKAVFLEPSFKLS